ncbi:SDR family NAD(P)-dependent oxidoreductase [Acinetobacter junii]|uniref:SDR family NAD(P)-dependent oxidoreductase n=1 Tax=Acinetobacter junii TaxID=40215 RepID=UPI0032126DDE
MSKKFSDKNVLITGGSRGIGAAIVKYFAKQGANVAFTFRHKISDAENTVQEAQNFGTNILAIQADSADASEVSNAVEQTAKAFGSIDILVNNAGIGLFTPLQATSINELDQLLAINVRGVVITIQSALKHMPAGGRIINIGSCNAERMPFPNGGLYAMSKSALVGLVKGLSRELGPRQITINNIQPGPTDTELNPANGEYAPVMRSLMAIDRFAEVSEIAAFVGFVASEEAGFITGASLKIDGGFTA